jgi:folylpolyglutamate synthase/dihydropteroate synthase
MADATLAARCQLVQTGQRQVLVDGAHNGSSLAAALAVAQRRLAPGWTLILGTARDKEIDEMLAVLPPDLRVVRCGFTSPRARSRDDWPSAALAWPWYDDIGAALADASGDVCVAGSLYLAGEALQRLG